LVDLHLLYDIVAAEESDNEDEETATKQIIQQVMRCYSQYSSIVHTVVLSFSDLMLTQRSVSPF